MSDKKLVDIAYFKRFSNQTLKKYTEKVEIPNELAECLERERSIEDLLRGRGKIFGRGDNEDSAAKEVQLWSRYAIETDRPVLEECLRLTRAKSRELACALLRLQGVSIIKAGGVQITLKDLPKDEQIHKTYFLAIDDEQGIPIQVGGDRAMFLATIDDAVDEITNPDPPQTVLEFLDPNMGPLKRLQRLLVSKLRQTWESLSDQIL